MIFRDLANLLEQIAPIRYAESWDNVGLLVGDPDQPISGVLLTIDYTPNVAEEAEQLNCNVVIAYHPPIFAPLKRIPFDSLIHDAIRRGVILYSPHTALDIADGGTNDMLADALNLIDRAPLREIQPKATQYKLVTFVPEKNVEQVSQALFAAGAGRIGQYSSCSFRSPGTGTFFGESGSNPTVGQPGRLEQTPELRLETVVLISHLENVLRALRQSHPYEEPAFDLIPLAATPEDRGMGRIGRLSPPVNRPDLFARIKQQLGLSHLLIAGPTTGPVTRAAVCAGACGDLFKDALTQQADLYLTGEMRHHDALHAAQEGMTVVCTLHSNSERATLRRLQARIAHHFPNLPLHLSQIDRDPFSIT